jgi:hypothetical protein
LCLIVLLGSQNRGAAQVWSLDAYAGRENYSAVPASIASTTGVLSVRFNEDRRLFQGALGLPMTSETVTWGVLGFGDRFSIQRRGFAAGAHVSVFAHVQRDPVTDSSGRGVQADVLPMLSQSFGAGTVELRSGPRWYGARLGGVDWTRRLWSTEFRGGLQAAEEIHVEGDLRHERGPESEDYTRVGFSMSAIVGRTILQGGMGHWVAGLTDVSPEWEASITVPLRAGLWVFSSVQRESFNPLFLNPARTSWSAGVTFRLGGGQDITASNSVRIEQGNRILIRVPLDEAAGPLAIAGDFTNWKPIPMHQEKNDWQFEITLAAGVYRYAFRTESGKWLVPENIPNRTDDGMGGFVAVLVVP